MTSSPTPAPPRRDPGRPRHDLAKGDGHDQAQTVPRTWSISPGRHDRPAMARKTGSTVRRQRHAGKRRWRGRGVRRPRQRRMHGLHHRNSWARSRPRPGAPYVTLNAGLDESSLVVQGGQSADDCDLLRRRRLDRLRQRADLRRRRLHQSPDNANLVTCGGTPSLALVTVTGGGATATDNIVCRPQRPANLPREDQRQRRQRHVGRRLRRRRPRSRRELQRPRQRNDTLEGNAGSDVLYADPGGDMLKGGPGTTARLLGRRLPGPHL